jgi:hypothetical protein
LIVLQGTAGILEAFEVLRHLPEHAPAPAGKSVVFLRECCGDADFEAAAAPDALRSGGNAALLEVRL